MHVVIIAYDGFTDVDLFMPWDLLFRVTDEGYANYQQSWRVSICADEKRVTSYSGLTIDTHGPLEWARDADAVFIVSGPGSRIKIADQAFLEALQIDPARQFIAAIDSGVLILAKLGLLDGLSATTYPSVFGELEAMGVRTERRPIVIHDRIATGGGCLSTQDLAVWLVSNLIGEQYGSAILDSVQKVEA